jgi:hypothetical protein
LLETSRNKETAATTPKNTKVGGLPAGSTLFAIGAGVEVETSVGAAAGASEEGEGSVIRGASFPTTGR